MIINLQHLQALGDDSESDLLEPSSECGRVEGVFAQDCAATSWVVSDVLEVTLILAQSACHIIEGTVGL